MNRIILTTCGTSLLESSCWEERYWKETYPDWKRLSAMKDETKTDKELMKANWQAWIDTNRKDLAAKFDSACWKNPDLIVDLPAELASLRAIMIHFAKEIKEPLDDKDKILFFHSNFKNNYGLIDGLFCAETVKNIVEYNSLCPCPITLEPFYLNPAESSKFGESLRQIMVHVTTKIGPKEKLVLNLTGGYKALAILFGGYARAATGTQVFYLHEEAPCEQVFTMHFLPKDQIEFGCYNATSNQSHKTSYTLPSGGGPTSL